MLIYLLKATLVWGFSLALFEGLLRKNSYHAANRAYLLTTLLAGLFLPLLELRWAAPSAVLPARELIETATGATQAIAAPASDGSAFTSLLTVHTILLFLYTAGFSVTVARLARDAAHLVRLRCRSRKEALPDGCTLYETGGEHGPFSFFRSIFLSSRDAYSATELAMVVSHEQQHARLLHSADMLVVQTLKVVLWFHPFIHLYAHRLRLVHEYEADEAAAQEPATYGRFLVEQAMASPAPTLTHAFHSPLKTRILMLTQNKRGTGRALRYALSLPMIAALVAAFSIPGYTDERKQVGNKLFYKGHEFEMTGDKDATVVTKDSVTGKEEKMVVTMLSGPVKMDGEKIHDDDVTRRAVYAGPEANATTEYFNRVRSLFEKLPDGLYVISLSSPVIDKEGRMAYHSKPVLWPCRSCERQAGEVAFASQQELAIPVKEEIQERLDAALAKGFRFKPAELDGKAVTSFLSRDLDFFGMNVIVVQGGKAKLRPR